ncbi:endonuclease/exonuclease/phosphatase family protein [Emticicia agri]|uniref:Endonuclease/exonuclease/phosphatase family protein n=1 Tax=Emticicia agri TaxID=2492393 RepID=A0A4Q5LW93_9BACT|nr:endonuclease/exonuclease/phosphatase family protein [Emticicia agri]RYU93972.1 endonuclease/exonuclease/phosphatase family protein [Emticicia agri]
MKILFWNLNKKDLSKEIKELIVHNDFDILLFCEYEIDDFFFLNYINTGTTIFKLMPSIGAIKLKHFTKYNLKFFKLHSESKRWAIRVIDHPFYSPFILASTHLPSKNNWHDDSQLIEASIFRNAINRAQVETNISRTVIIGDFNMNPYESGLISTTAFHSTQDRNIAKRIKRRVQGNEYNFFYNPMWNFFGDQSIGKVPGTYLYSSSEHLQLDWNIFDQVLLSPDIIDFVPLKGLEIITNTGKQDLIRADKIIDNTFSDHLPIKLELKTDKF